MPTAHETPEDEPVPPECRATVARIQSALDGAAAPESLDRDPHAGACAACRERVHAARLLLAILATPSEPVVVPSGFTNRIVAAVRTERQVRTRDRATRVAAWLSLAAAVLIGVWFIATETTNTPPGQLKPNESALQPIAPVPQVEPGPREPAPEPAPEPRPLRLGEAVADTEQALLETPRPFADSMAVAPKVFDVLSGPFLSHAPPADPMGTALAPARKSLSELPIAARAGLEPVTDTAEKALARFLRDMGSVKPNS